MNIIVACCSNQGIGNENSLPWHFKSDLKYFAKVTKGHGNNSIVMGKNTWLSLPRKPLPKRDNLILSKSLKENNCFESIYDLKNHIKTKKYDEIWIIGGSQIYNQFINDDCVKRIYMTYVERNYKCDTFFPKIPDDFLLVQTNSIIENETKLTFDVYAK